MKNIFLLLFSITTSITYSQSNFQGKAIYMSKTSMDMDFGGRQMSEDQKKQIAARMKSFLEKTFVLNFNQVESTYKEEESLSTPVAGGGRGGFGGFTGFSGGLKYKNTKDSIVLEETEFFGKNFLISEPGNKPDWKLGSETKTIGNYICYKATLVKEVDAISIASLARRGRGNQSGNNTEDKEEEKPKTMIVTAWYTPQIPVSQGPGEFWGLPGLILEVNTDNTTLLCTEVTMNPKEKVSLTKPSKGKKVTREEYNTIVKKKTKEMIEQFQGGGGRGNGGGRGRG
jgi:GLPGLI family protein